jgi:hypothetical protein
MISKTVLSVLAVTVLGCAAFTPNARAVAISGDIYFTGIGTLNGTPATATQITFTNPVDVEQTISTGNYGGFSSTTTATFATPFVFGALGTVGPNSVTPLWSITDGLTYEFNLANITVNAIVGSQRLLEGTGTATISGGLYDPTPGYWTLSTSGTGASISFSSFTSVPDGGTTVALLGMALLGVDGLRRKLKLA